MMVEKTIIVFVGSVLYVGAAVADVIYEQDFDNPSGANAPLNEVDWNVNLNASGASVVQPSSGPFLSLSSCAFSSNNEERWGIWTDDASFGSISDITSINMSLHNENAVTEDLQFALKVDGDWYVSQSVFNGNVWASVRLDA
ncbi:hypothetical protein ACWPKO_15885 [Coraliomargarita sp. W4R53]